MTNLEDASEHIGEVLKRVKKEHLQRAYKVEEWYVLSLVTAFKLKVFCFLVAHVTPSTIHSSK